jgi:hypothetical protein
VIGETRQQRNARLAREQHQLTVDLRARQGDGIRRWPNGANSPAPYTGLLNIDEVNWMSRSKEVLDVLSVALPKGGQRRDAAIAARAIKRLLEADAR